MDLIFILFVGVISFFSGFVVLKEIKENHPEYYEKMDNWGIFNNHFKGTLLFTKFIIFNRSRVDDPVAYICCLISFFGMISGVGFGVWVLYNIFCARG